MVDLLDFMRGAVGPDGVNGKPVGVKHADGGATFEGIFQVQRDGATRRWFQVKGAWNNPPPQSDWEELWHDDQFIYRAIDTSRKPGEGGPYTLYDVPGQRGSKWARRFMNVGETFARSPTVAAFDLATGAHTKVEGQAPTWLKLQAVHARWHGINDVAELWWLLKESDGGPAERYFYAKGLGLVGFIGSGMTTTPNAVFPDFPPATGIPVLVRKPAPWLPPLSDGPGAPVAKSGFRLLWPLARYTITDRFDAPRPYANGKHEGLDLGTQPPGDTSAPVLAGNAGVVEQVGDAGASGYGRWARLRFDGDGGQWRAWYAHLSRVDVAPGDRVTAGQAIGRAGATGNASGVHVHLTLTHPAHGLDGYSVDKVVDPLPYLVAALPVAPVPVPEPEPEPPPVALYAPLTRDELQQLALHHEAIAAIYRAALARQTA